MKISVKLIQKLVDFPLPDYHQLAFLIGQHLGEVENIIDLNQKYADAVIVKVIDCQPIDGSDHLKLCLIDDSGLVKDVKRNQDNLIQVVCGAPNVRKDLVTVWLPPTSIVPETYLHENFKLSSRAIRNHTSHGMLASPKELDFSDDHQGIIEIEDKINPGQFLKHVYELDDQILEIENKMFTRRPDCFGLIGIAREVSIILSHQFHSPAYYVDYMKDMIITNNNDLTVKNLISDLVPNYDFLLIDNLDIKPSPMWLKINLIKLGLRPINNLVDLTNWIMHLTGQPLHAYDFDLVADNQQANFVIRSAHENEQLQLINGKNIKLRSKDLVIANQQRALGLAGVMGGKESEISDSTSKAVIEIANFDYTAIRQTAMNFGIYSDAVTRFTKQQNPDQIAAVRHTFLMFLKQISPNSKLIAEAARPDFDQVSLKTIKLSIKQAHQILGSEIDSDLMIQILRFGEFNPRVEKEYIVVQVPFWRSDLEQPEDMIEEIGRVYGYDKLPKSLMTRNIKPSRINIIFSTRQKIRQVLSAAGANELLTYSFVSTKLLNQLNLNPKNAYKLANALSPELNYYRLNLVGSLLDKVQANHRAGFDQFAIYELGRIHDKSFGLSKELGSVPNFAYRIGFIYSSKLNQPIAYYETKYYLDYLLDYFNIGGVEFKTEIDDSYWNQQAEVYLKGQRAFIVYDHQCFGVIGSINSLLIHHLKLPNNVAGFEFDLNLIFNYQQQANYQTLGKYPAVHRDLCFSVAKSVIFSDLNQLLNLQLSHLLDKDFSYQLNLIDIYQPKESTNQHFTFRLQVQNYNRTLTDQEINQLTDQLIRNLNHKIKIELV